MSVRCTPVGPSGVRIVETKVLHIYQLYRKQPRIPDGALSVDGTTDQHSTRRPSPDRLKTFAANASRKLRKMTMAHPPKTSSRDDSNSPLIQTKTDVHT